MRPNHQQLTFLSLFPLLKPGGIFIIEDMHWQPETYAATLPRVPRTDVILNRYLREGHFSKTGALDEVLWNEQAESIKSVTLFDVDWFNIHRRQFNARYGLEPDNLVYIDRVDSGQRNFRNLAGRIFRTVRSEVYGLESCRDPSRIKAAVIQKVA